MIRNAKYMIRIKLLKNLSHKSEGAALKVGKELQEEKWDNAKGGFCVPQGVCVLSRPAGN